MTQAQMLSPRQVADLFGVSKQTVLGWAKEGHLPSHKLGPRTVRFNAEEIAEFGMNGKEDSDEGTVTFNEETQSAIELITNLIADLQKVRDLLEAE